MKFGITTTVVATALLLGHPYYIGVIFRVPIPADRHLYCRNPIITA